MDTPACNNSRSAQRQVSIFRLLLIFFTFVLLFGVTGCFDSETEDVPPSIDSAAVGAVPEPSAGLTLYTNNCSVCHPDSSRFIGYTAAQINAAIANVSMMNAIALTTDELQTLADYLSANSGGGSDGGSGGGGTLDGQALYTANCEGCHGTVDVTTVNDASVSGISTALNLSFMSGVSITADEIQAISDFLGGGSGGGGSGAPPASHTNSEDGIMHAPGNTLPFTNGCTVCHGATLAGGVGPSCFTCHGQRWDEGPGSVGGGTGGSGSPDGQMLYTTYCSACHGVTGSVLTGQTVDQITAALSRQAMSSIALSLTEVQAIADYLVAPGGSGGGDTGGGTGGGDTGGGTGGTLDGQALYTDNCASCHGAIDVTTVNDPSVSGINNAIANLSFMSTISLTAEEIQAISDYLTGGGGTGGTGGGDTGGTGGGTLDGQALYTDNCASCHGAIDVTTVNDPSVSGINNAIANLGFMSGIALTADEIQAISDYLTGGGGTGGGDTGGGTGGGLPTSHTNSEEGVLHGEGNDYPYTNGCTACHGSTLQGAAGPSCFACHGVEWIESAPGGDTGGGDTGTGGGTGGTLDGATLYADNCSVCHGSGSGINDPSVNGITAAMTSIGSMTGISLNADEIQAISDHLTGGGGTGGTGGGDTGGTGGGTGGTLDGATLYADNCSLCHGAGSGINDPSVNGITAAMTSIGSMTNISLTADEIQAISDHLTGGSGGTGGGDTGGGDTGGSSGPPASHTNPEDGILHAPGNNYPYTNGCTLCHGTTLQGGVGPSCFACHGQEWNESTPSGGDSGGSTGGGGTGGTGTDGQALYATYCSACHGATGSSINNNTANGITSAINGVGSMNNITLTSIEIQAIADYLSGSTGGSTGGTDTGGGGVPTTHTNSEQGVLHGSGNNYPYTNGCTSCHGSTLQGGVGPSCYSCHGQEWRESAPSGSDGGSDGSSEEEESS